MYIAEINVMPLKELLDPQGKAVENSLKKLGFNEMSHVRIGKNITLRVEADSKEDAAAKVDAVCKKMLHNPVMEYYEFELKEA